MVPPPGSRGWKEREEHLENPTIHTVQSFNGGLRGASKVQARERESCF